VDAPAAQRAVSKTCLAIALTISVLIRIEAEARKAAGPCLFLPPLQGWCTPKCIMDAHLN